MFLVLKGLISHLLSAGMQEDNQCLDYSCIMKTIPQCVLCLCSYLSMCQRKNRLSLSGEEGGRGKKKAIFIIIFLLKMHRATAQVLAVPCRRPQEEAPWELECSPCSIAKQCIHPGTPPFLIGANPLSIHQTIAS